MANLIKSNLNKLFTGDETAVWHDIKLSKHTVVQRNIAKLGMDNFTSFTWRGIDAFDVFGAFVINKNSLKFYNGPTYSNSYTKPQFDSAYGQLTGITFNVQKIDFMIGVYWISESHYRRLINWLNPYEINTLAFGFEPNYYYQVKLASVEDGIRYIIGKEDSEPIYYTEMKLSFEVQGPACAYHKNRYELISSSGEHATESTVQTISTIYSFKQNTPGNPNNSDMAMPIEVLIKTDLYGYYTGDDSFFNIILDVQYAENQSITLFDVTFKNQTYSTTSPNSLDIKYESESGLLLLNMGDSEYILLNQLSTSNHGKRIIDSIIVNHFEIPGLFDDCQFDMLKNLKFKITIRSNASIEPTDAERWLNQADFNIRARTNLI